MIRFPAFMPLLAVSASTVFADGLGYHQTLYDLKTVSTRTLIVELDSVDDDVRFSVTLTDGETGFKRRHEFDGQGSNDVSPYLMQERYACGVDVILLTVEYPWRHDLPQYVQVLDTFAFRDSNFEYIDDTFGPLTDIAIMDSWNPDRNLKMLPPILVECLPKGSEVPFRFDENPVDQ